MSEKNNPIEEVLKKQNFSDKEKAAFLNIIKVVKQSQSGIIESPKNKIDAIIEETVRS